MKTEQYGRHKITFYESIDELPIDRFTAWNRYMMIDTNLGATFEDIDRVHLSQLASVLGDTAKSSQVVANLRELVYSLDNRLNYNHHAYCCMIAAIDGVAVDDYTDNGIKETLKRLDKIGVTNRDIKKKMNLLKKAYTRILKVFSPISFHAQKNTIITQN